MSLRRPLLRLGWPLLALAAACAKPAATTPPRAPLATPTASSAAACPAGPGTVAARVGGKDITLAEVDEATKRELFEAREKALDRLVNDRVVGPLAEKAGQSIKEF